MKLGIIIVFRNNKEEINTKFLIDNLNKIKHMELCFVNNESKDNTYKMLKEIKSKSDKVSLVNIKKYKSHNTAIRAGARYMFNEFRLDHLGYINVNDLKDGNRKLATILEKIHANRKPIIELDKKMVKTYKIKRTSFQKLFSVVDYLTKLKLEILNN